MSHLPPVLPALVFFLLASGSDTEAGNSLSLDHFRFFEASMHPVLDGNCQGFNSLEKEKAKGLSVVFGLSAPGTSVGPGGAAIVPAQSPPEVASPPTVGEPVEHLTSIVEISGARVTFLSNSAEAGAADVSGGGRGNMRRGRSGGGAAAGTGALLTLPVTENTLITTVVSARRTGDLLIGEELPGGLANGHFENMGLQGLRARLVVQGGTITEINVFISQEEATPPIAIKPKRPPVR